MGQSAVAIVDAFHTNHHRVRTLTLLDYLVVLYDNEEFEWGSSALAPGFFPLAKGEEDGTFVSKR